jgi:hypothetical protein
MARAKVKVLDKTRNKDGNRVYYTLADVERFRQYNASIDLGSFGDELKVGEEYEVEGDFLGEKVYFRGRISG